MKNKIYNSFLNVITLVLTVLFSVQLNAQESDFELIQKTVNYYLEGGTNNDFEVLKKAFHPNATMKYIDNGEYKEVNAIDFFGRIMKLGPKQNRITRVNNINISGNAASVELEMEYPTFSYIDFMNLLKIDGEWKVVNKIFYTKKKMDDKAKKKILFVLTSHSKLGETGKETGYYLSEVSHPWHVLHNAGYEIDFVSPKGGEPPVDGFDLKDPINNSFWKNEVYQTKLKNTKKPNEVDFNEYAAIHYAGGHGTMWDLPNNKKIAKIAAKIYENNGVVSAVCHGPAGIVNIKLNNGKFLVDGKRVNSFTNEEEKAVKLENKVPFLLESKLKERGAKFEKSELWQEHVTVDGRLITGQNPASATAIGNAILQQLQNK